MKYDWFKLSPSLSLYLLFRWKGHLPAFAASWFSPLGNTFTMADTLLGTRCPLSQVQFTCDLIKWRSLVMSHLPSAFLADLFTSNFASAAASHRPSPAGATIPPQLLQKRPRLVSLFYFHTEQTGCYQHTEITWTCALKHVSGLSTNKWGDVGRVNIWQIRPGSVVLLANRILTRNSSFISII